MIAVTQARTLATWVIERLARPVLLSGVRARFVRSLRLDRQSIAGLRKVATGVLAWPFHHHGFLLKTPGSCDPET